MQVQNKTDIQVKTVDLEVHTETENDVIEMLREAEVEVSEAQIEELSDEERQGWAEKPKTVKFDLSGLIPGMEGVMVSDDSGEDMDIDESGDDWEGGEFGGGEDMFDESNYDSESEFFIGLSDSESTCDLDWWPQVGQEDEEEESSEEEDIIENAGRRGKLYNDCKSSQGKRLKLLKIKAENSDPGLNLAFARDIIKEKVERESKELKDGDPIVMSRELAALSLIKQARLSRGQYKSISFWLTSRAVLGEENTSLPSWHRIREERKKAVPAKWPAEGECTAKEARIGLQPLLDSTVKR